MKRVICPNCGTSHWVYDTFVESQYEMLCPECKDVLERGA